MSAHLSNIGHPQTPPGTCDPSGCSPGAAMSNTEHPQTPPRTELG